MVSSSTLRRWRVARKDRGVVGLGPILRILSYSDPYSKRVLLGRLLLDCILTMMASYLFFGNQVVSYISLYLKTDGTLTVILFDGPRIVDFVKQQLYYDVIIWLHFCIINSWSL